MTVPVLHILPACHAWHPKGNDCKACRGLAEIVSSAMRYRPYLDFQQDLIRLQMHGTIKGFATLIDDDDPFELVQHYEDVVRCHIDDLGDLFRAWGQIRPAQTWLTMHFIGWCPVSGQPFIVEEWSGARIGIRHLVEHGELFPRPLLYRALQRFSQSIKSRIG